MTWKWVLFFCKEIFEKQKKGHKSLKHATTSLLVIFLTFIGFGSCVREPTESKQQTQERTDGLDLLVKHHVHARSHCLAEACDALVAPNAAKRIWSRGLKGEGLRLVVHLCQHISAGRCAEDTGSELQHTSQRSRVLCKASSDWTPRTYRHTTCSPWWFKEKRLNVPTQ